MLGMFGVCTARSRKLRMSAYALQESASWACLRMLRNSEYAPQVKAMHRKSAYIRRDADEVLARGNEQASVSSLPGQSSLPCTLLALSLPILACSGGYSVGFFRGQKKYA